MMTHHENVVRAAADDQVPHVVYLCGVDADLASPFCYAYTNGYTGQLLAESGCAVSVARASVYTEFFLRFLEPARGTGEIRLPAADGRLSLVSREDVGRCLAALATSAPTRRWHAVTGPEALDVAAVAATAARRWGTPVRYTDVAPAAFAAELAQAGEDPWWTYAFATMFASVRQHRLAAVSEEVAELTGRQAAALSEVIDGTG